MASITKEIHKILAYEKVRLSDMKEIGQVPDTADYLRLYNTLQDFYKRTEQKRRTDAIQQLRKINGD